VSSLVIVANPVDVAVADQAAAALGRDTQVCLTRLVIPGNAYVLDHQELYELAVEDASRKLGETNGA
jgi:hypothetical protein